MLRANVGDAWLKSIPLPKALGEKGPFKAVIERAITNKARRSELCSIHYVMSTNGNSVQVPI